jgi:hypothetical protein
MIMSNSQRSAQNSDSKKPGRLHLEQLESRWLLACASNFDAITETLSITCNGAADVVNVRDNGTGGITGEMNGLPIAGAEGAVRNVAINTGRGHDRLTYELQGSLGTPRNISIITDKGNDQIDLDLCVGPCIGGKGAAPDSINDDLSITIQSGDGHDRVAAQFDEFVGEYGGAVSGFLSASLGKGIDQLDVDLLGDLVSAAVMIVGNGEAGTDRMSVDALTDLVRGDGSGIDVSSGSRLSIDLSGGGEIDRIDANYNGIYNGNGGPRAIKQPGTSSLSIQVDGGLDDDILSANVELDSGSTGSTDVDVDGAAGFDRLQLLIVNAAGAEGGPVDAAVDGGLGRDRAIISQDVVASEGTESVNVVPPAV